MANRVDNSDFFNGSPGNLRRPLEESSSNVELTGIDTVSDATLNLNNGLLHDVKLIPQKDINMVPGESPIYNNFHENAIKGIHEETGLSEVYFSPTNISTLQAAIRYDVNQKTGKIVDKQSSQELSIVMRSIYLQNGNPMVSSDNIVNEIRKLNDMVIEYCSKQVSTQVLQYDGYIDRLTTLPVPIERPQQVDRNNFTYDISNLL
tara:strand:+ start:10314 stop:10928 length:615 start_codon:yes stop_codon:yes gene_type:complete